MKLSSIKLLQLIYKLDLGGAERFTLDLSNNLVNNINELYVLTSKGLYSHKDNVHPNIKLIFINNIIKAKPVLLLLYFLKIISLALNNKINIINYHTRAFIPVIFLIKLLFPQIKIMYTAHCVFNDKINHFLNADAYLAVSRSVFEDLRNYKKKNIFLLQPGIVINSLQE